MNETNINTSPQSGEIERAAARRDWLQRSQAAVRQFPRIEVAIPEAIRRERHHRIFQQFLKQCHLSDRTRVRLQKHDLNDAAIEFLIIRETPGIVENLEICVTLVNTFGDITDVTGFVRSEFGNCRLDIDLIERGRALICAERAADGVIRNLRIFWHAGDERGFAVETRRKGAPA